MVKCCRVEHETPFCPHCGRALDRDGLGTLLKHCRDHQGQSARHLKEHEKAHPCGNGHTDQIQRAHRKWTRWVEALKEAMVTQTRHKADIRPIEALGELSVRARNCLARLKIETVCELTQYTSNGLLQQRNMGESSVRELRQKLAGIGASLKGETGRNGEQTGSGDTD